MKHGDWLSNGFTRRVTIHSLSALIPAENNSIQRFADDGVIRRFYKRGEVAHGLLGLLAFGNIAQNNRVELGASGIVLRNRSFDRKLFTVSPQAAECNLMAHCPVGYSSAAILIDIVMVYGTKTLRNEPINRLADCLCSFTSKHSFGGCVE